MIKAENGKEYHSQDLFIETFKFIDKERKTFCRKHKIKAKKNDIQWILVVPSVWKKISLTKIKHWLNVSGLIGMSYQVEIISESMAASLAMQKEIKNTQRNEEENKYEGEKYILIDAGGRFTKISCHRIGANNTSSMIYSARKTYGGYSIDNKYIKLLHKTFGKETMDEFKKNKAKSYEEMMNNFMKSKHTFAFFLESFMCVLPKEFINFLLNTAPDGVKKNRLRTIYF